MSLIFYEAEYNLVFLTLLIFTAEIVSLVQSIGVCGVRDVKLLLPDIIKKGVRPWKGVCRPAVEQEARTFYHITPPCLTR